MTQSDQELLAQIEEAALGDAALADALRRCVALAGRAGSEDLRQWASRELRGYAGEDDDALPDYRVAGAPILLDGVSGYNKITGQRVSPKSLPEFTHDKIGEEVHLLQGIGELEALVEIAAANPNRAVHMSLPMAAELVRYMNSQSDTPYQQITGLYWSVSEAVFRGVVDRVRTTLVELVAELRTGTAGDEALPSAAKVDQAVQFIVYGNKGPVTINTAQSSAGATSTLDSSNATKDSPSWTRSRRIGAFIVGVAAVAGAWFAFLQLQEQREANDNAPAIEQMQSPIPEPSARERPKAPPRPKDN